VLVLSLLSSSGWLRAQAFHSAVRILSPKEGEVLGINIVHCKYQLVETVTAASKPTFQLQLDDRDPVRTVMTDHTFTGLKEGPHELLMMVVDANNNPIPGTRTAVNFKVQLPHPSSAASHPRLLMAAKSRASTAQSSSTAPEPVPDAPSAELPDSGSALPLLAVLCGGALAGGALSVLRTRGRRMRK
jgi:hypothetical protein